MSCIPAQIAAQLPPSNSNIILAVRLICQCLTHKREVPVVHHSKSMSTNVGVATTAAAHSTEKKTL
jgi:hypothetical protein